MDQLKFEGNPLTGDLTRFAPQSGDPKDISPQLAIGQPTFAWLYAGQPGVEEVADPGFGPATKLPILWIASPASDEIVAPASDRGARPATTCRGAGFSVPPPRTTKS